MNPIVDPFQLSTRSEDFCELYPDPTDLKNLYVNTNHFERLGIIRLWITEGIPYAFKKHPLLYEEARRFIAQGVKVETKEVSLVGSARIGYSLSKREWGRPFNAHSDFDFTIVSNVLYASIVTDFQNWVKDLEKRKILPKDPRGMDIWLSNIIQLDKQIPKGFIQTKMIPYHDNYPTVKKCYDTIYWFRKRLGATERAPRISDASIRVYSSWKSCINQIYINFKSALDLWSEST
jgi:hypothetical protein